MSKKYSYNDMSIFDTYEECADELRSNTTLEQLVEFFCDDYVAVLEHGLKGDTAFFEEEYEKAFKNFCEWVITEWDDEDDVIED